MNFLTLYSWILFYKSLALFSFKVIITFVLLWVSVLSTKNKCTLALKPIIANFLSTIETSFFIFLNFLLDNRFAVLSRLLNFRKLADKLLIFLFVITFHILLFLFKLHALLLKRNLITRRAQVVCLLSPKKHLTAFTFH